MVEEAARDEFIIDPKKITEHVRAATGLSKNSITHIKKEPKAVSEGTSLTFSTPKKNLNQPKPMTDQSG